MDQRRLDERVKVGMPVVDLDGKRLGKVTRCDPWAVEVTRGFWSPSEWVIRWDEILDVDDRQQVRVARSDATLFVLAQGGMPEFWQRETPPLTAPYAAPAGGHAPAGGPAPGESPAPPSHAPG